MGCLFSFLRCFILIIVFLFYVDLYYVICFLVKIFDIRYVYLIEIGLDGFFCFDI